MSSHHLGLMTALVTGRHKIADARLGTQDGAGSDNVRSNASTSSSSWMASRRRRVYTKNPRVAGVESRKAKAARRELESLQESTRLARAKLVSLETALELTTRKHDDRGIKNENDDCADMRKHVGTEDVDSAEKRKHVGTSSFVQFLSVVAASISTGTSQAAQAPVSLAGAIADGFVSTVDKRCADGGQKHDCLALWAMG